MFSSEVPYTDLIFGRWICPQPAVNHGSVRRANRLSSDHPDLRAVVGSGCGKVGGHLASRPDNRREWCDCGVAV